MHSEGPPDVPAGRSGSREQATVSRKREHLRLVLDDRRPPAVPAGWDDVRIVPRALPVGSAVDVELSTSFLDHDLRAPLVLAGMTGGFVGAERVNAALGEAAEHLGLAVGVGSQRAALADPGLEGSFAAVRRRAPRAFVLANIGAAQLVPQGDRAGLTTGQARRVVEMVGADALAVHLNLVQELVQAEGDRRFDGIPDAIGEVVSSVGVPVVVKETGAGMDRASAGALAGLGVAALDVGGAGGTSFTRVEQARGGAMAERLGQVLDGWGIPTAAAILEVRDVGLPVVATGGVRSGHDAARALALGADLVGVGRPAVEAAMDGAEALVTFLEGLLDELRIVLLLGGAMGPTELAEPVLSGPTLEWGRQRALL